MNFDWSLVQVRVQDENQDNDCGNNPNPAARHSRIRIVHQRQPVIFQGAAGLSVSSNLPFQRQAEHKPASYTVEKLDARVQRAGAFSVPLQ